MLLGLLSFVSKLFCRHSLTSLAGCFIATPAFSLLSWGEGEERWNGKGREEETEGSLEGGS